MPLVRPVVVPKAVSALVGDLTATGHGKPPLLALLRPIGSPSPPPSYLGRSDWIQWSLVTDTPSRGKFSKEALPFFLFKPVVQGTFHNYILSFE